MSNPDDIKMWTLSEQMMLSFAMEIMYNRKWDVENWVKTHKGYEPKPVSDLYSTSPTGSENHLSPLRFQTFNRKYFEIGMKLNDFSIQLVKYCIHESKLLKTLMLLKKNWMWKTG